VTLAPLVLLLLLLQDLVSAAGDAPMLQRIAKIMAYISASSKGGKKGERDSAYIRSILAGGTPAAGGDAQVGPSKPRRAVCFLGAIGVGCGKGEWVRDSTGCSKQDAVLSVWSVLVRRI
jgi:hypothetical protein